MSNILLSALAKKLIGDIAIAKANIQVYQNQSVGIGEHPEVVQAIELEVAKMAEAQDKLDTVNVLLNEKEFIQE